MENLKNLEKIAKIFQPQNIITTDEIDQVLKGIMEILASYKKGTDAINEETKAVVNILLDKVVQSNKQTLDKAETVLDNRMTDLETLLKDVKQMINDVEVIASSVEDGKDADEEKIVEDVISRIKIDPTVITVSAEEIRNKLSSLEGDNKLDISAVKGFDLYSKKVDLEYAVQTLQHQTSTLINRGGVKTIVAGTNITVDNTDPSNPVISSSGGGGGTPGGSTTQLQYNNAGSFGGITGATTNGTSVTLTSPTFITPALGTPASGVATNLTGTASGLTAGSVTTNANLTGPITSIGNATSIASQTGTGTKFVVDTAPTLQTSLGITEAVGSSALTLTGATQTSSFPVINATQTWNNAGTTFTGIFSNITNTASNAASLLADLQVGGASKFKVDINGSITLSNQLYLNSGVGTGSIYVPGTGASNFIGFTTNTIAASTSTIDTYLRRGSSAATIQLGNADAAAPIAQNLAVQSVVTGTTNTAGANFTIKGSQGTGTGTGGDIIFKVAPAGTTGTAQNALATALTISNTKTVTFGSDIIGPASWDITAGSSIRLKVGASAFEKFFFGEGDWRVSNDSILQWSNSANVAGTMDTFLGRKSAATIQLGNSDAASPVNQTLVVQGSRSGTDTNVGGANLTIQSGNGTGTGTPSSMIFQAPVAVASGTGAQTQTTALTLTGTTATFTGQVTAPNNLNTNNAITAVANAATVPITSKINTVTNNSAAGLTITLTTSGAIDGQITCVRILDFSAVAQTLTFVNTENSDVSVPATSNGSTTLPRTVLFQYNSATSKHRCIANV